MARFDSPCSPSGIVPRQKQLNKYLFALLFVLVFLAACEEGMRPLPSPRESAGSALDDRPRDEKDAKIVLTDLLERSRKQEFFVSYAMRVFAKGESQEGRLDLFVRGDDMRSDLEPNTTGKVLETRNFFVGGVPIGCINDGEWRCLRFPKAQIVSPAALLEHASVSSLRERLIAGAAARCFQVIVEDAEGRMVREACYSVEGVPLFVATSASDGEMREEATTYRIGGIPADAFVPPAKPEDAPQELLSEEMKN